MKRRLVRIETIGVANTWSWERHMQAVVRDLPPDEAREVWLAACARRAKHLAEARTLTA